MTTPIRTIGIIDVETTSLDPATGHVVEVALAVYSVEHRALIRARSWLCAAPIEDVAATEHIHGIPPALVAARGVPFAEVAKQAHAITTKELDLLAAHHADFDRGWFPPFLQNAVPWVCTLEDIAWPRKSSSRALTSTALAHGVGVVRAHRALEDVLTLAALFDRAAEIGADLQALFAHAMRPKVLAVANTPKPWEMPAGDWETLKTKLQDAGFRFVEQPEKRWQRSIARDDIAALPFEVREVST
jgi:DNA polymerase-3 subunit epsilon